MRYPQPSLLEYVSRAGALDAHLYAVQVHQRTAEEWREARLAATLKGLQGWLGPSTLAELRAAYLEAFDRRLSLEG